MKLELKNYKVVIIDYPVFGLDDPNCAVLLGKAFKMKLDGYAATYSERALPFDKADFFGTHIMFCEQKGEELIPVFAYKSTPLDRCLKFHYEFPATTIMNNGLLPPSCLRDLNAIIEKAGDPSLVSFDSAWAQDLDYRFKDDKELKEHIREIMMMVIVKHHQDHNIPHMLTSGAVKVKTDLFFKRIGMEMLNEEARFKEKRLDDSEGIIFYTDTFSFEALSMAKKHEDLWDNRIIMDGRKYVRKTTKVA